MTLPSPAAQTKNLPTAVKSVASSAAAASFRIFLMPIDACKTILQVEGADGLSKLRAKIQKGGVGVLWHGDERHVRDTSTLAALPFLPLHPRPLSLRRTSTRPRHVHPTRLQARLAR